MAEHTRFEKLVADAKKNIREISPKDAAQKLKRGEALIVDVREKDEWDEEHVAGATHLSRGTIELDIEEKVPDLKHNHHLSLWRWRPLGARGREFAKDGLQKCAFARRRLQSLESCRVAD